MTVTVSRITGILVAIVGLVDLLILLFSPGDVGSVALLFMSAISGLAGYGLIVPRKEAKGQQPPGLPTCRGKRGACPPPWTCPLACSDQGGRLRQICLSPSIRSVYVALRGIITRLPQI